MVRINRVHTGGGDGGETSLVDGSRVSKDLTRLESVGTIDELNASLGMVIMESERLPLHHPDGGARPTVRQVQIVVSAAVGRLQQELFDLGAELACPVDNVPDSVILLQEDASQRLVEEMDAWLSELDPLTSFILPTGEGPVATLHVARTITRRLERSLVRLRSEEGEDSLRPFTLGYVNRLSDWCFVLGRWITRRLDGDETLWQPVGERQRSSVEGVRIQQRYADVQGAIDDI